jgi:heme/copper-type cytochrome/quinol oxidase subunit 4
MRFYVFALAIPLVILVVSFLFQRKGDGSRYLWLVSTVRSLPYQYIYLFLLYFLEMEDYVDSGGAFYTLFFFLVPISIIAVFFHLIFRNRSK